MLTALFLLPCMSDVSLSLPLLPLSLPLLPLPLLQTSQHSCIQRETHTFSTLLHLDYEEICSAYYPVISIIIILICFPHTCIAEISHINHTSRSHAKSNGFSLLEGRLRALLLLLHKQGTLWPQSQCPQVRSGPLPSSHLSSL